MTHRDRVAGQIETILNPPAENVVAIRKAGKPVMSENPPPDALQRALIERLLEEHGIDADDPERLERLVLAMEKGRHQQAKRARRPVGRPYGMVEDFFVLQGIADQLAKLKKHGLVPSISAAAEILAKMLPYKVWGMSAPAIRKRQNEMLRRLRSSERLQPELESLLQKRLD